MLESDWSKQDRLHQFITSQTLSQAFSIDYSSYFSLTLFGLDTSILKAPYFAEQEIIIILLEMIAARKICLGNRDIWFDPKASHFK